MKLLVFPVALAALVFTLAGCTTVVPRTAHTGNVISASPEESATRTPSAAGTVVDSADVATWTISAVGVGPATLGMQIDEAVRAMGPALAPESAPSGCSVATLQFLSPAGTHSPNGVMLVPDSSGKVAEIMVMIAGPATRDHLGVGSTVAAVLAAHPDAEKSLRAQVDPLMTLVGDPGSISFESTSDKGDAPITIAWVIAGDGKPEPEYCGS